MSDSVADTTARIDRMLAMAERNGWNGALNAARVILPVEHSIRLRALYKRPEDDPGALVPSGDQAALKSRSAQAGGR